MYSSSSSTSSSSSSSSSSKVKKVKKVAAPKKKKAKAPEIDAQWSWRTDSGAWEPYDEKVNAKIEALHNKKPPKSGIKTAKIDAERGVDLSRMVQYRLDDPSRIRQLKREENEESSDDSDDDSEPDEKAMLAKLRSGLPKKYMRMAAVPILGATLGARARMTRDQYVGSRYGGAPYLLPGEKWPKCGVCTEGGPKYLRLMCQFDLAHVPATFRRLYGNEGLLQYMMCDDECDGWWDSFTGGHIQRVVRVAEGPADQTKVPAKCELFPIRMINGWEEKPDYPHYEDYDDKLTDWFGDDDDLQDFYQDNDDFHVRGDKLGGWPDWTQSAEYPACSKCGTAMNYVFNCSGDHVDFMYGDCGTAQIMQCPKHKDIFTAVAACC
eukprot:TRINITY_DN12692_c0_g1_i2.p1 TRINITY_DN12692_c0_g1~~TRINITY_DN12692_c0_g1_i2.p1  ORF type:complete len:379 (-),score=103.12 TRINITY_DN12692_c0_g1_i2:117-1253(-)